MGSCWMSTSRATQRSTRCVTTWRGGGGLAHRWGRGLVVSCSPVVVVVLVACVGGVCVLDVPQVWVPQNRGRMGDDGALVLPCPCAALPALFLYHALTESSTRPNLPAPQSVSHSVWHFCEIAFLAPRHAHSSGTELLAAEVSAWLQEHYCDQPELPPELRAAAQPERHAEFWAFLFDLVLQGQPEAAGEALGRWHSGVAALTHMEQRRGGAMRGRSRAGSRDSAGGAGDGAGAGEGGLTHGEALLKVRGGVTCWPCWRAGGGAGSSSYVSCARPH